MKVGLLSSDMIQERLLKKEINIDKPRYDQSTYVGRAKHFFLTTNPLNLLKTSDELEEAKTIVQNYRLGIVSASLTEDKLWRAKNIYDSAYHPDTGEKMFIVGRISAQIPGYTIITAGLLNFYKSSSGVIFWQWINQTFGAIVNYTNRSGSASISNTQSGISYVLATTGAVTSALFVKNQAKNLPPVIHRLGPLIGIITANFINVPCMRSAEMINGTTIRDENGKELGQSTVVGHRAIGKVILSRILLAFPSLTITVFAMNLLEKRGILTRYKRLGVPIQMTIAGIGLTFLSPLCCALFPQISSISVSKLEPELQAKLMKMYDNNPPSVVYYNKGL